jgi:hypothetical protein
VLGEVSLGVEVVDKGAWLIEREEHRAVLLEVSFHVICFEERLGAARLSAVPAHPSGC